MAAQKIFLVNCGFLVGILIAGFFDSSFKIFYFLALAIFLVGVIFLKKYLYLFSLVFIGLFFAIFYFGIRSDLAEGGYPKVQVGSFRIMSISETLTSDKSRRFNAKFLDDYRGKVTVFYSGEDNYKYGQIFLVSGDFKSSEQKGGAPVIFAKEVKVEGEARRTIARSLFEFKDKLVAILTRKLSSNAGALASGLLLGEKSTFSGEFKEAMRKSGTTHIVALSGFNISILVGALGFAVSGFARKTRIFLYFLTITVFTVMVGAEPSIVRAAIMGCIFLLSKELGRDITPAYALSFAGVAMLIWNPLTIYSVGFQLSFLSFAGIAYLSPIFESIFKNKFGFAFKLGAETFGAQIVVLPLVVNYFGGFSAVSFLANILILGTIPLAMFFVFLLLTTSFIAPIFSFFFAWICEMILGYQILMIDFFAKLHVPMGSYFKSGVFTAIYMFLVLGFIIINKERLTNERK